jgi:competence protein ComEC
VSVTTPTRQLFLFLGASLVLACSKPSAPSTDAQPIEAPEAAPETSFDSKDAVAPEADGRVSGDDVRMTIRFYDVGEGLAALVELPDKRHILVDTGDSPHRADCGDVCIAANHHLLAKLREDLHGAPIDLLWITHPHSDHIGGAPDVLEAFSVGTYADNGRDTRKAEVRRAHQVAEEHGVAIRTVDPEHSDSPLSGSGEVTITPVLPSKWPASCAHDANECSIALRIEYRSSSVLFTGDAEHAEEATLDPRGPVTLLQIGHHGSDTSTTPMFLAKARPTYAVISAGKPGEGLNREYCHPRALIVERLTKRLGGKASKTVLAFDGLRCDRAVPSDWIAVPASESLWITARDGDVVLTTVGDGTFSRL